MHHDRRRLTHHRDDSSRPSGRAIDTLLNAHVVTAEEAGKRVDLVIAHVTGEPRSVVADAIARGTVKRNGATVKGSAPVEAGDTLDFTLPERVPLGALPEAIDLDIVYEDEHLLVVDKPAGMVTHPAHGSRDGTLVNALLAHTGALPGDPLRPGLVHRLDRDTSGLLVVAKTAPVLTSLGKAMMRRYIEREYLGLVVGVPEHPKGTIEGGIGRDPHNRLRYAIRADGKPATTHYELREKLAGASELTFRLETGRTHQIRVHLAAFGHPIIGDPVYGKNDLRVNLDGQALHAWRLSFRHPVTREDLVFEVEPPTAYREARERLRTP